MGKSFNDDIFNKDFDLTSINGLNISKEAIEENEGSIKETISKLNLDEIKKEMKEQKADNTTDDTLDNIEQLKTQEKRLKEKATREEHEKLDDIYIKKTMIFKQEYLDIIDGLATINDMQIKDVLNQLLGRAINELDSKVKGKALKSGKKTKPIKESKNIF